MSTIRFPDYPESEHPQYLWNEQEFIIRMLNQNRIGVKILETNNDVTVSLMPNESLNHISNGPVDYPKSLLTQSFGITAAHGTRWIYIKADASKFYDDKVKPIYNQYLHGWYHSSATKAGDRAVVFIDTEQENGYKCIVMDSYNAHLEYEQRIPYNGGDPFYNSQEISEIIGNFNKELPLDPGSYRFHLKAGNGGNGGNNIAHTWMTGAESYAVNGGKGVITREFIYKIVTHEKIKIQLRLGGNGSNGENSKYAMHTTETGNRRFFNGSSGGGGSSGGDTCIKLLSSNNILFHVFGGAGGGGAAPSISRNLTPQLQVNGVSHIQMIGAGGGGAGYGIAEDGNINANQIDLIPVPGKGGTESNRGTNGRGLIAEKSGTETYNVRFMENTLYPQYAIYPNQTAENITENNFFRKGGGYTGNGNVYTDITALGGQTESNTITDGYIKIYKIRDFTT